jgi:superoxide dismutase
MEEFDLDFNQEVGTSVSKLKTPFQKQPENKLTESDIDYDKIIKDLNNSDSFSNQNQNINSNNNFSNNIIDMKPKKEINMNQFARNLENDLDYFSNVNHQINQNLNQQLGPGPKPINYTPDMDKKKDQQLLELLDVEPVSSIQLKGNQVPDFKKNNTNDSNNSDSTDFISGEYKDFLINLLLFMLLNNKFIVDFIQTKIPFINQTQSPFPNLIVRSLLFAGIILGIKKFIL